MLSDPITGITELPGRQRVTLTIDTNIAIASVSVAIQCYYVSDDKPIFSDAFTIEVKAAAAVTPSCTPLNTPASITLYADETVTQNYMRLENASGYFQCTGVTHEACVL